MKRLNKTKLTITFLVLLFLTLLTTSYVANIRARYQRNDSGSDSAETAAFAFQVSDTDATQYLDISNIKKPGDSVTYDFTVSNKNGDITPEVAMKYQINVSLNGSIPLTAIVKQGSTKVLEVTLDNSSSIPSEKTYLSDVIAANTANVTNYTITITWPADKNDAQFSSNAAGAEAILTVSGIQVN